MVKRKIIKIDDELCTGCGECIPNCPEGAIQLIDDKARIISDIFCDGLGACMGHCPVDAISIEEREAEEYDERKVMANVIKQGENVIKAHLEHMKDHNQDEYLHEAIEFLKEKGMNVPIDEQTQPEVPATAPIPCGCPGSAVQDLRGEVTCCEGSQDSPKMASQLQHWPVQLMLVPPSAPYLKDADLLLAADCVPCSYPNFHNDMLKDKIVMISCPKFDNMDFYKKKLTEIFRDNNIKSVTTAIMEVPCCFGLVNLVKSAIALSGKEIPLNEVTVSVKGEILED